MLLLLFLLLRKKENFINSAHTTTLINLEPSNTFETSMASALFVYRLKLFHNVCNFQYYLFVHVKTLRSSIKFTKLFVR